MIDDLGVQAGLDGRVVRHRVGDVRPRAHRHAELEVNLVVCGTASYLRGDRRYALTPGTLTWLFPGQNHVLVEEFATPAGGRSRRAVLSPSRFQQGPPSRRTLPRSA